MSLPSLRLLTRQKTLILHVGTHRTGTSALQQMLRSQHTNLAENGIYIPLLTEGTHDDPFASHHAVVQNGLRGGASEPAFRALLDDLRRNVMDTAIVSSENFSTLYGNPDALQSLAQGIRSCGYTCRIVLYVRDRCRYAESLYAELVKHGLRMGFFDYLQEILREGKATLGPWSYSFEYSQIADAFAAVFGRENTIVRPYRAAENDAFILHDLLSQIDGKSPALQPLGEARINASMTFMGVLQHLYEKSIRLNPDIDEPLSLAQRVLRPAELQSLDAPFAIIGQDAAKLANRFEDDDRRLSERYGVTLCAEAPLASFVETAARKRLMRAATDEWKLLG